MNSGARPAVPPAGPSPGELDRWILSARGPRNEVSPSQPFAALVEEELSASGELTSVATIFLTNRECPFRCLMCDLWKNTLAETVSAGSIPGQIAAALSDLPPARLLKLYNSGSFFDPGAIPPGDYPAIAALAGSFERVIVECHPAFIGDRVDQFRTLLSAPLEVAMGLETANPDLLARLNKRMTRESFARAAGFLGERGLALRVFILLRPPYADESEGLEWAMRSIDFAFDCGAAVCTIIPTRAGNGALDQLEARGEFSPPKLSSLLKAVSYGAGIGRGRVFADLWDIEKLRTCTVCFDGRRRALHWINETQAPQAILPCPVCGE